MYFNLKKPNSDQESLVLLRYYINKHQGRFVYSTEQKVLPKDWDSKSKMPLRSRGRVDLAIITSKLNEFSELLDTTLSNAQLNKTEISKEFLKTTFDRYFQKGTKEPEFIFFTDYVDNFVSRSHTLINRTTKKPHKHRQIQHYKKVLHRIIDFEKYRKKRIPLNGFTIQVYDEFVNWLTVDQKYSINYTGNLIKRVKVFSKWAESEGFVVSPDYKLTDFSVISERTEAIALNEKEIDLIAAYDFSSTPYLENTRDLALIGLWTGVRVGDLMKLPEIKSTDRFLYVTPEKTADTSGVKVVIPIHHQIKDIIEKRGMPRTISKPRFNEYIKEVCFKVGITDVVQGSLIDPETKRKKKDFYPKHKLVSSHTCRRSFATNMYLMGFPILSIMKITGHKSMKTFLIYIKVSPTEHAERLLEHWEAYYSKRDIKT